MPKHVPDPPSEPIAEISVPVRLAGRGVHTLKPLVQGKVSTGACVFDVFAGIDTETSTLHFSFHGGDSAGRSYLVTLDDVLQVLGDLHQRRAGEPHG